MEVYLQITAFIVLVYALKIRMYRTNIIGLITILMISVISLFVEDCSIMIVIFLSVYLVAICFYDFFKRNAKCFHSRVNT